MNLFSPEIQPGVFLIEDTIYPQLWKVIDAAEGSISIKQVDPIDRPEVSYFIISKNTTGSSFPLLISEVTSLGGGIDSVPVSNRILDTLSVYASESDARQVFKNLEQECLMRVLSD